VFPSVSVALTLVGIILMVIPRSENTRGALGRRRIESCEKVTGILGGKFSTFIRFPLPFLRLRDSVFRSQDQVRDLVVVCS